MVLKNAGSKSRYLTLLDPYFSWLVDGESAYGEPCVAGGSTLIRLAEKYPHLRLLANDLNPYVTAFWEAVSRKETAEALCERLKEIPTLQSRAEFLHHEPHDLIERAYGAVVIARTSRSGIVRAKMFNGGRDETHLGKHLLEHWNPDFMCREIRRYHQLVAGRLVVSQVDARLFAESHLRIPMFVDPPYVKEGHKLYRCSMSLDEHRALATTLKRARAAVITYDHCPEVLKMYAGCRIDQFPTSYSADRTPSNNYQLKQLNELIVII